MKKKKKNDFQEYADAGKAKETAAKPRKKFKLLYGDERAVIEYVEILETHLNQCARIRLFDAGMIRQDLKNLRNSIGVIFDKLWDAERSPKDPRKRKDWPKIKLQWKAPRKRKESA